MHVFHLAESLYQRGMVVHLFYSGNGQAYERLPKDVSRTVLPGLGNRGSLIETFHASRVLRSRAAQHQPRIVHVHSTKAGLVARLSMCGLRHQTIFTVHGWGFGAGRTFVNSLVAYMVELLIGGFTTDRYICVSAADRAIGSRWLPFISSRMTVVHNGIPDLNAPRQELTDKPAAKYCRVIMVARTGYQKNHEAVKRAFTLLPDCFMLTLVGGGTDSAEFKAWFTDGFSSDEAKRVQFLGGRLDISELLLQSDIFLLSSRFEGLPLSIIEAMRAGLPIVSTDVGGVAELVSDNGFLIQPGPDEYQAICTALTTLQNPVLRRAMGARSRNLYTTRFKVEPMVDAIVDAYQG
jgi:glycosyltransferase involved in cell wall biosynthesis